MNSDAICPSVVVDGEVPVVDKAVSSVKLLSSVEDSNVDMVVGVITVVNVDLAAVVGSVSLAEVN